MGNRATVIIQETNVCLYTHWNRNKIEETVIKSLKRGKDRWYDSAYLARIIFSDMIEGQEKELSGFGISTEYNNEEFYIIIKPDLSVIVTDPDNNEVRYYNSFSEYIEEKI